MRAATSYRPISVRHGRMTTRHTPSRLPVGKVRKGPFPSAPFLYGLVFLLGYFPGILYGRLSTSEFGSQLAEYYLDPHHFSVWSDCFSNQMAASFLQLLFLIFCGFSVFGAGLLVLFFLMKGAFLGLCAVNVLALGGGGALAFYWFCSCLPNLLSLLIYLWLSNYATWLSRYLFQGVFSGGAPRGQLEASRRRFLIRCGSAFLLLCLFGLFYSGLTIWVVSLLIR